MAQAKVEQTKFLLAESELPRRWYNIAADMPNAAPPVLHPGTGAADRPRRSRAALPDGAHRTGGQPGALRSRSRRRSSTSTRLWRPDPALPGAAARAGGRDARRGSSTSTRASARPAATSRTPRSRRRTTTSQGGPDAALDRDRRRPVGLARSPWPARSSGSSARSTWSGSRYDQKPYRRSLMETWGAEIVREPAPRTRSPGGRCSRSIRTRRAVSGSRSRRRSRTPRSARTPSTRSAPC